MRRLHDDRATALLVAYLRHVEESTSTNGAARDEIVIVLPQHTEIVERRTDGRATEIKLRIESAT